MNTIKSIKKLCLPLIAICVSFQIAFSHETNLPAQNRLASFWEDNQKNLLSPDPAVIWGQLDNGLHYAIMPNQEPPYKVSLRLLVNAGSFMETEPQRGLAHFLEHMAFKGGKNFPNQQALTEYFQHIGMAFGADTNAHTGMDQTVYKLELPNNTNEYLNDGLRVLRDFADGLLINPADIDSERGVILAEKRDGYTVEERIQDSFFEFVLPGTLIPKRFPIGLEEIIKNASREQFQEFYNTWYNPNRFYLIITGDVDPQNLLALIKNHFGSIPPTSIITENPNLGQISPYSSYAKVFTHNEITSTNLEFIVVKPHENRLDTQDERILKIQRSIPYSILTERLDILCQSEKAPFCSASSSTLNLFNAFDISYLSFKAKPGMAAECIALAEQEVRRILQFGFTKEEMQTAITDTLNSYQQAVISAPRRNTKDLSSSIVSTLTAFEVYTSPQEDFRLAKLALQDLSPQKCLELFSQDWLNQQPLLFLTGNQEVKITPEEMLNVYQKSKNVPVEEQKSEPLPPFAYQTFGKPGTIIEEKYFPETDIYQYRFNNNVRLNLKETDFATDEIAISVQFGSGLLELPPHLEGIDLLATSVFDIGGLSKHSIIDINRIFAGKTTSMCFSVKDTAFEFLGCTNNRDFPDQISLMAAYLSDPGYREEAFRLARHNFDELYESLDRTPENVLSNSVDRFLANNNYLFGFPDKNTLYKLNKNNVIQWLLEPLSSGFLEISIVGDFDREKVISIIAKTFGSLPKRALSKEKIFFDQSLTFPQEITKKIFPLQSEFEKAICAVYWPTTDRWNISPNRKLSVLAAIFDDRLRKELREKLGEAYSPHATNLPSTLFKDYGRFFALAIVQPNHADQVTDIILNIGKEIFEKGVTKDEFNRALQPILHKLDTANRSNCYWLTVLNDSQLHPEFIEWAQNRRSEYQSLSPTDINQIAKEYLNPNKAIRVIIIANKQLDTVQ